MLLDLSLVTRTLLTLIKTHVEDSPAWPGFTLEVLPDPPDKLTGDNVIGMYLYHLGEDASFKNVVAPGGAPPDVRFTPMALTLHYVLRAHSSLTDEATFREQLLMGCAVKALRDYPIIDEHTRVVTSPTVPILDPNLAGKENRLRLSLQPVPPQEAVSYWTAGQTPLRLASYYQVTAVLLEPDTPRTASRRVLSFGVNTFVGDAPRLHESRSRIRYRPPGLPAQVVEARPAQAAVGEELVLAGHNLAGARVGLVLRGPGFPEPIEVDAAWDVRAGAERVTARVQASAAGQPVHPGIHSAQVKVVRLLELPGGGSRELAQTSNAVPVAIAPGVDAAPGDAPFTTDADGRFTVGGSGLAEPDLEVFVGEAALSRASAPLPPGSFRTLSATSLEIRLPPGLPATRAVGLRVVAGGVESAPRWVSPP